MLVLSVEAVTLSNPPATTESKAGHCDIGKGDICPGVYRVVRDNGEPTPLGGRPTEPPKPRTWEDGPEKTEWILMLKN